MGTSILYLYLYMWYGWYGNYNSKLIWVVRVETWEGEMRRESKKKEGRGEDQERHMYSPKNLSPHDSDKKWFKSKED